MRSALLCVLACAFAQEARGQYGAYPARPSAPTYYYPNPHAYRPAYYPGRPVYPYPQPAYAPPYAARGFGAPSPYSPSAGPAPVVTEEPSARRETEGGAPSVTVEAAEGPLVERPLATRALPDTPAFDVAPTMLPEATGAHCSTLAWGDHEDDIPAIRFHREHKDRWWLNGRALISFFSKSSRDEPLVTIGSFSVEDPEVRPGALGAPGTGVLRTSSPDMNPFYGLRLEAGYFLDCDGRFSLEMAGFGFVPRETTFQVASDGTGPIFARPFIDAGTGQEFSAFISVPGLLAGATSVFNRAEAWSFETNARWHCYKDCRLHMDGLLGIRFFRLRESLRIQDDLLALADGVLFFPDPVTGVATELPAGSTARITDRFGTRNDFYGLQFGGQMRYEWDWLTLALSAKLGIGVLDQSVNISGSTTVSTDGGASFMTAPGGLLALPSNIGNHNRTAFALLPELGVNFEIPVCKHVRLLTGYNLTALTGAMRPSGAIDRTLDRTAIPSGPEFGNPNGLITDSSRPAFSWRDEIFMIHSFNLGIEIHY